MPGSPEIIGSGTTPVRSDTLRLLLVKDVNSGGGSGGGGGGGTASNITFGHYAGGQPNFTPASGVGAAFDIDTGRPWYYYSGAWN
jgi:hypothetical protein